MHHPIKSLMISLKTHIGLFSTKFDFHSEQQGSVCLQKTVCYIAINLRFIYYISQTLLFSSS